MNQMLPRRFPALDGIILERSESWLNTELFPSEEDYLSAVSSHRRSEFRTVRALAARCLKRMGAVRTPMIPGMSGASSWPAGICGSMTHTTGAYATVIAPRGQYRGIGIDAEWNYWLPESTFSYVATPSETSIVASLQNDNPDVAWGTLLFSAKEAAFKARELGVSSAHGIRDMRVRLHGDGTFDLGASSPNADTCMDVAARGWWYIKNQVITTLVVL